MWSKDDKDLVRAKLSEIKVKNIRLGRGSNYTYAWVDPKNISQVIGNIDGIIAKEEADKKAEEDAKKEAERQRLSVVEIDKYKPNDQVLNKIKEYYKRGSRVNVKAIRDDNKLFTYYYAAHMIGFYDLCDSIRDVVNHKFGWSSPEHNILDAINNRVETQDMDVGNKGFISNFNPIVKYCVDNGIEWSAESRRPTSIEMEKDAHNGRIWTLAYTLKANGKELRVAVHTDEGDSGPHGYCLNGIEYNSQKDFTNAVIGQLTEKLGDTENMKFKKLDEKLPKDLANAYNGIEDDGYYRTKQLKYRNYKDHNINPNGYDGYSDDVDYEAAVYNQITSEEARDYIKKGCIDTLRFLVDGDLVAYDDENRCIIGPELGYNSDKRYTTRTGKTVTNTKKMPLSHVLKIADKIYVTDEKDRKIPQDKLNRRNTVRFGGDDGLFSYGDVAYANGQDRKAGQHIERGSRDWDKYDAKNSAEHNRRNRIELKKLELDWQAGNISKNEYERQKNNLLQSIEFDTERGAKAIGNIKNRRASARYSYATAASRDAINKYKTLKNSIERNERDVEEAENKLNDIKTNGENAETYSFYRSQIDRYKQKIEDYKNELAYFRDEIKYYEKQLSGDAQSASIKKTEGELDIAQQKLNADKAALDKLLKRAPKNEALNGFKARAKKLNEGIDSEKNWEKVSELEDYEQLKQDTNTLFYEIDNCTRGWYTQVDDYYGLAKCFYNLGIDMQYFSKQIEYIASKNESVEDKAKETQNPVYADATRQQEKTDEIKDKVINVSKDGKTKLKLDESMFDDADEKTLPDEFDEEIYPNLPEDEKIIELYEKALNSNDINAIYNYIDEVCTNLYPGSEHYYFDWKESDKAAKLYHDSIAAGAKVYFDPSSEGNDGYGMFIVK